tara:strand:+ start:4882 stop:6684 length:1803 start_codon:yes stop_codon:yes gene_type:complete
MIVRIALLFALLFATGLQAGEMAKVIRIRGYATQLAPGAMDARAVEMGQKIFEDTSILTKDKSFVVLEFSDSSRMSIGPNSKVVVVKARNEDAGLVSLLKGKIRSQVSPEDNDKDKYIIRTRTAAMGVRGTDFQSSYNPDNKATSLVTFKGKVAMARLDSSAEDLEGKNIEVSRNEAGEPLVERARASSKTRIEELKEALSSDQVVSVEKGEFSGAVAGLKQPTQPVVINPVQIDLMYKSDELAPTKSGEKLEEVDFSKVKHRGNPNSSYNAKTGKFTPRAGGFVDPDTALYIPPREDAILDVTRNIYQAKDIGFVNKDTGDYVPPEGLILDARNGFVPKVKDGTMIAQAGEMNRTIAKDVVLKKEEDTVPIVRPNKRERVALGSVSLRFGPGEESHTVSQDSLGNNFKDNADGGFSMLLSHDHAGDNDWQAITRLGLKNSDHRKDGFVSSKGNSLWSIAGGARHAFSPRVAVSGVFSLEQTFIYNHPIENSSTINEWSRFTIPTLDLTLETEFFRTNRFAMIADIGLLLTLPKSKADVDVKSSMGYHLRLGAEYWVSRKMTVGLSVFGKTQFFELESSRFTSEDERSEDGLNLQLQYFY